MYYCNGKKGICEYEAGTIECPEDCTFFDGTGGYEIEEACPFCEKFEWSGASVEINERFAHIRLAVGSTRYEIPEQFNFCPVCGSVNPNKKGGNTDVDTVSAGAETS